MAEVEVNKSVAWIEDMDSWPQFPWCPIKNLKRREPNGFPMFGRIHASELTNVRSGTIWQNDPGYVIEEYDSVKALVVAGWVVD